MEALAGKRQGQIVAATIKNFSSAEKAMDNMANSAGSANNEMAIIMDSIEYKINALKETGTGIAQNLFQREDMKSVVDGATALLGVIDQLTEKLGLFGTVAVGAGIGSLIKNFNSLRMAGTVFSDLGMKLNEFRGLMNSLGGTSIANVSKLQTVLSTFRLNGDTGGVDSLKNLSGAMKSFNGSDVAVRGVADSLSTLSNSSKIAALSMYNLNESQATAILTAAGLTGEELSAGVAAVTAGGGATVGATGFEAFAISVGKAAVGIKTFLLTTPLGWFMILATAVVAARSAWNFFTESMEEAKEAAEDSKGALEDTLSEISNINSELKTTNSRLEELDKLKELGTLSPAEQKEYDQLVLKNKQLSLQLEIKKKLASYQQKESASDANHVLTKDQTYSTGGYTQKTTANGVSVLVDEQKSGDVIDKLQDQQEALKKNKEELARYKEQLSGMEVEESSWWEPSTDYEKVQDKVSSLNDKIKSNEEEIASTMGEIGTYYGRLFDEDGNVISGYEDTVDRINRVMESIPSSTGEAANAAEEAANSIVDYAESITSAKEEVNSFKEFQTSLATAMADSNGATGLAQADIDALILKYKDLEGYDPAKLFEQTANGVHLNEKALKKLNEQYETKQLEKYAAQIKNIQDAIYSERAKGNDTSNLEAELEEARLLKIQYEGLTSAYNDWITAKSGSKERDSYANIGSSYEEMKKTLNEGWYGDEALNSYLDLLLSAEKRTGDAKKDFAQLNKEVEGTDHTIMDYWQYDKESGELVTDGLFDFLDDVNSKLGDEFAKINKNGKYEFNFDGDNLQKVADSFGISTEAVELFEKAMIDAGLAVDMNDKDIVEQINDITSSLEKAQKKGELSKGLNLNFDVDKDELEDVKTNIDALKKEKVKINAEENPELAKQMDDLIEKCEKQYYIRLNAETDGSLDNAYFAINGIKQLLKDPYNFTIKDESGNSKNILELATMLANMPKEVQVALGIKEKNVGNASNIIEQISNTPETIAIPVNFKPDKTKADNAINEVNEDEIKDKSFTITAVDKAKTVISGIKTELDKIISKTVTVTVKKETKETKKADVNGTAHADGTFNEKFKAYSNGTKWSLGRNEDALVNELGTESIVRDGKWFQIPGGAHVEQLKKNDIIFSAQQTAELIRTGKVTSGGGHGRRAYSDGTAYALLNAYDNATDGSRRDPETPTVNADEKKTTGTTGNKSKDTETKIDKTFDAFQKYVEKLFDWVEIRLTRLQKKADNYIAKAEKKASSGNYTGASKQYKNALSTVNSQINANKSGKTVYENKANEVLNKAVSSKSISGSSKQKIKDKVADGSIRISEYGEKMRTAITEYQKWYEKSLECSDNVQELLNKYNEYAETLYNLPIEKAASKTEKFSNALTILDKKLENATSVADKKKYLKSEISNAQSSNKANRDAYTDTKKNLKTIENALKLNKTTKKNGKTVDYALKGLSGSDKKKIRTDVKAGKEIDYTKYSKLSDKGIETIIKYNNALKANQDAYQTYQESQQDTIASIRNYAETLANLPLDKAAEKVEKFSDAISLLDKKISNTTNSDSLKSLYEEKIENERGTYNANNTAYKDTKSQTKTDGKTALSQLKSGINKKSYTTNKDGTLKATKKASKSDKEDIKAYNTALDNKNNGKKISTYGVDKNSKAYASIVKYNKGLISQEEAYKKAQESEQDYISSVKETAESMANLPIDKAAEKVDKADKNLDVLNSKYDVQNNASGKNSVIDSQLAEELKKKNAYDAASSDAKKYANDIWKSKDLKSALKTSANKGKKEGEKLSTSGLKKGTAEYEAVIKYNKALDAQTTALQDAQKATYDYTKANQEAAKKKFDNVKTDYESNQSLIQSTISKQNAELSYRDSAGLSQTSDAQKEIYNASIGSNNSLLSSQNSELADLKKSYADNSANMSEEDKKAALQDITNLETSILSTKSSIADLQSSLNNIEVKKLENSMTKLKTQESNLQDAISEKEAKGLTASASDYQSLINNSDAQIENLKSQNVLYVEQQKLYEVGSEKYNDLQSKIDSTNTSINNAEKSQIEWNNSIAKLPYTALDKALDSLESIARYNQSIIDLKKSQGNDLSESDYFQQMQDNEAEIANYEKKRVQAFSDYTSALASPDGVYGGKTAAEWKAEYESAGVQINTLKKTNEDLKNSLRDDVYWRNFERAHDQSQRLLDVLSGISSLLDENMFFDSDNNLTGFGTMKMANDIKQMEVARTEVQNYSKDIANLNSLFSRGEYTQEEYNSKFAELQKELLDSASSMKSFSDEVVDMYKNMAQAELDSIFEVIDARNEALQSKKDYYDYDKTIKSKSKDILTLQAQIDALEGVSTSEAKAQKASLAAQLAEAQEDMNDTINEHIFEMSQNTLSDLKDTLQETFDDKWKALYGNFDELSNLLSRANELTSSSASGINSSLNKLLEYYGISPTNVSIPEYASGTKRTSKSELAWTQELGDEIIVRGSDGAILTPLTRNSGVIPATLTDNLYKWGALDPSDYVKGIGNIANPISSGNSSISQHYDSLLNVEGNVDSSVITDLKGFAKQFYEGSYEYTTNKLVKDARKNGRK